MQAGAFGGIPPYSYSWSTGDVGQTITDLGPGNYTVTVTDGGGNTAQATGTVEPVWALDAQWYLPAIQADCNGSCTGMVQVNEIGFYGTPPYAYTQDPVTNSWGLVYENICSGSSQVVEVFDANGCPGSFDLGALVNAVQTGYVEVINITPACAGEANGTMTVRLMGGSFGAYLFVGNGMGFQQTFFPGQGEPFTVSGMSAGSYGVSAWLDGIDGTPICTAQDPQVIPELSGPCATLSGTVFNDADQDCTQGPEDPGLPYRVLTIQPGPSYAISDQDGAYFSALSFGNFTLAQPLVDEAQLCPAAVPVPFTVDGGTPTLTIDLADSSFVPHDLEVLLYTTAFRPGFPFTIWGSVRNNTAYASGTVSLALSYPTLLDPVTASAGGTANGGNAEWNFALVPAYANQSFAISGTLPPDITLLGEVLVLTASATNSVGEASLGNNTNVLTRTVTGSYDPNDKQGTTNATGSTDQFFLNTDVWFDYTVRFQNTGTDTAFTVVIRDDFEVDLDIQSLEILAASHAFVPSFGDGRELVLTFPNILLPDSTTDLIGSQGFVAFRMEPRTGLLPGDVITNTAGIYFDFNEPIITNTTEHVVEFSTGVNAHAAGSMLISPNPARDGFRVDLPGERTARVILRDLHGRAVKDLSIATDRVWVDTENLASGSYIVEAISISGYRSRSVVHVLKP